MEADQNAHITPPLTTKVFDHKKTDGLSKTWEKRIVMREDLQYVEQSIEEVIVNRTEDSV